VTVEFVDTNVLVYAYDPSTDGRHTAARDLLERLWRERNGALSVQVLQEFYVTITRKVRVPVAADVATERLRSLARWRVHAPLADDAVAAAEISTRHQLSFWDAMIVRSAAEVGCHTLWTEDLNDGQQIEGVRIQNPFLRA
jgi:predicted nucleic acid-binding protein